MAYSSTEPSVRRRSGRIPLRLAVTLFGVNAQAQNFEERAETWEVSKHGARVQVVQELKVGTVVSLERPDEDRTAKMKVVFQQPPDPTTGKRETGIEFVGLEGFWGISFPPDKGMWT